MRRLLAALLLAAATGTATAQGLDAAGGRLRQGVLLPLYAGYLEQARAFAAVALDCAGDWREPMRAAYTDSVLAWRRLEAAEPVRPWLATRRPRSISGPTSTAPPAGSSPRPCATATRR